MVKASNTVHGKTDQSKEDEDWNPSDNEPLSKGSTVKQQLQVTFHGLSRKHKHTRKYNCTACDIVCDSVDNLNIHFRTTHPLVKCKKCGKSFATPNTLKHHGYEHKKKTKKCSDCNKSFVFSSQLNEHHKTHRKLKPYLCPWIQNGV